MKKILSFGIVNNEQEEKNEIILSNKIALIMFIFSSLWSISYFFILPTIKWIPLSSTLISLIIIGLNYLKKTNLSRILSATSYSSILFITHALLVNHSCDFFIPIYIILIAVSLFSWNLFLKNEKKSLQFTFVYNLLLICGQSFFNTYFISSIEIGNLLHDSFLIFINYLMAISIFYFSLNFFFDKLTKQHEKLIISNSHIEKQQELIQKQNEVLQNHIIALENTKKLLIQKEAETRSINSAIYNNFLIAEYDIDGKIIDVNQNLLDFIGLPKDEIITHQQDTINHLDLNNNPENHIHFMRFWTEIRKGKSLTKEHKYKLPTKTFWVQSTFAPILDENGYAKKIISINQDISNLKEQQFLIKEKNNTLINNTNTLLSLNKNTNIFNGHFKNAIEEITLQISQCLNLHRVSVWKYNNNKITCQKLYLKESNEYAEGIELFLKDFPIYFDALFHEKIIVAINAHTHEDTKEFKDVYLLPLEIFSMLDIPIFYEGKLWGVICCEHKYTEKHWSTEDISFVKSCCDMISLSISSYEQEKVNLQLAIQQDEILMQNTELISQKKELVSQRENIAQQKIIIEDRNKKLLDSISYAKRIQDAILPTNELFTKSLDDFFIFHQPKDIISGDFYWLKEAHDKIFLAAIDCTGHGVPGALVSIVANNVLNRCINEFNLDTPADILNKANQIVSFELNQHNNIEVYDGMDISLIAIDTNNQKIEYAGAFNPLYYIDNNKLIEIKGERKSIGFDLTNQNLLFKNHEVSLETVKTLYLFSDGFADQFGGPKDKKFSYKRFKKLLVENQSLPLNEQKKHLENCFNDWKGLYEQIDDVLVIGIQL